MTPLSVALVLVSALAHAYWNFLLKRAGGSQTFVALSKIAEAVIFAPVFLVVAVRDFPTTSWAWFLLLVATFIVLANYLSLAQAYTHGDLSFVYPVSRGSTLIFLPLLASLTIGEHVSAIAVMAMLTILAGIVILQLPSLTIDSLRMVGHSLKSRATIFAVGASLATAVGTIWDKVALRTFKPFPYLWAYTCGTALCYATFLMRRPAGAVIAEWRAHRWPIILVGMLNTVSYGLVLLTLRASTSSYVIAFRQLSIAFGVLMGWLWLRETIPVPRRLGVVLLVAGCLVIATQR